MTTKLQRTPLYDACVKAGGKMVDFHGWELPVQFEGIIAEHKAVRENIGMFDVSHMGQIMVEGKDAYKFLQMINTNNIKNVPGQGVYSHLPNEKGGVIDDVVVFCLEEEKFLVVVNSATTEKDLAWFNKQAAPYSVKITDLSSEYGMVAVQGPQAIELVEKLAEGIGEIPRFGIMEKVLFGSLCFISRTGYTGEDGVEVMAPFSTIEKVWDFFMEEGKEYGLKPCGLGSRDVLRLEAGYLLYGSDIDDDHTPYEAGFGWVVKLNKEENFTAKEIYVKQKAEGVKRKLTKFRLSGAGVPRPGCSVLYKGAKIGTLTSGTYSPLFKGICEGYVNQILPEGEAAEIENNGRKMPAEVVKGFYKNRV
jgi:aminomethyltransferase